MPLTAKSFFNRDRCVGRDPTHFFMKRGNTLVYKLAEMSNRMLTPKTPKCEDLLPHTHDKTLPHFKKHHLLYLVKGVRVVEIKTATLIAAKVKMFEPS